MSIRDWARGVLGLLRTEPPELRPPYLKWFKHGDHHHQCQSSEGHEKGACMAYCQTSDAVETGVGVVKL